jgi:hypothetical protein
VRFLGDEITEREVALRLAPCLEQGGACARDRGVGLRERQFEARAIDHEQDVAGLDSLIVMHRDLRHQPRHVGRDTDDIGADATVARPRIGFVAPPQPDRDQHRERDDDQGDGRPAKRGDQRFQTGGGHAEGPVSRASSPRRRMNKATSTSGR